MGKLDTNVLLQALRAKSFHNVLRVLCGIYFLCDPSGEAECRVLLPAFVKYLALCGSVPFKNKCPSWAKILELY